MAYPADEEAYLLLIDRHIEELKQRLDALRDLIVDMVARGEDTSNQSELFCNRLAAVKATKAVRERAGIGQDTFADAAWRRQQAAGLKAGPR